MTTTSTQVSATTHISEIFPLNLSNTNYRCFRLSPQIDREIGNRFSWRLSQSFENVVVIWDKESRDFWILAKPGVTIPEHNQWREKLENIQEVLKEDIGERFYMIQWVDKPQITPSIKAELAVRILNIFCQFSALTAFSKNQIDVKREVNFWSEVIELDTETTPAIVLTLESSFLYRQDLEHFFNNHPDRHKPETLLVNLKVRDIEKNSNATIVGLAGTIGERKDYLLQKATGVISRQKLQDADEDQPVVSVQFSKNGRLYDYPLAALRPCVTSETAYLYDVLYGELLKQTKIPYSERQELLIKYTNEARNVLAEYEFKLCVSINSRTYTDLFWEPKVRLEDTPLLFGSGKIFKKSESLKGLSQGGVYQRHSEFKDPFRKIRLAIIKPSHLKIGEFRCQLQEKLERFGFKSILPQENQKNFFIESLSGVNARAKLEDIVNELLVVPPDIVLAFLPEGDRNTDDTEEGSLYSWIYSRLLCRGIASQMIYENTIKDSSNYNNILKQVVPGILAKLGNLPFVLAEPLDIADYFIGLDIARIANRKSRGSRNACASVRLYGKQGEFIRYRLEDALIEGEEIPQRTLENFLPKAELQNKIILIYRDGRFQGKEIEHLLARAEAINAKLILVECAKSQIPRLYNLYNQQLNQPTRGLALNLSSREVILTTTQVPVDSIGVPRPLRLRIHERGEQVCLKKLVDATLKLTLLHYGSLKDPRLPIPLFGSDRIAYRRLQGIYPSLLEDDRQPWL